MNHFKIFMQKLYTLYSASPKNRRCLESAAAEVGVALLKIGRVLDVRWVASSLRTASSLGELSGLVQPFLPGSNRCKP